MRGVTFHLATHFVGLLALAAAVVFFAPAGAFGSQEEVSAAGVTSCDGFASRSDVTPDVQVIDSALPRADTVWVLGIRTHLNL
jgi:hypothetical protein